MKEYVTIREQVVAEYTVKHSRFIATAVPVSDYDDALARVAAIKKQYIDATHNCYALIADDMGMQCKYSDDGEPQGTAGPPMLEVLRRKGLSHVLVVVTRYFGGIKLGANGLVGAYTQSVAMAIDAATKVRMVYSAICRVRVDYALGGKLTATVQRLGAQVTSVDYENDVCARVVVPEEAYENMRAALVEWAKGNVTIEREGYDFREFA